MEAALLLAAGPTVFRTTALAAVNAVHPALAVVRLADSVLVSVHAGNVAAGRNSSSLVPRSLEGLGLLGLDTPTQHLRQGLKSGLLPEVGILALRSR